MNNLEWLARNVHEWPSKSSNGIGLGWKGVKDGEPDYIFRPYACGGDGVSFSKAQWADERQRLQNKPSWDDAPEWAEWLGQSGSGVWRWYDDKPHLNPGYDSYQTTRHGRRTLAETGQVLGDWRETLEGRPNNRKEVSDNPAIKMGKDICEMVAKDVRKMVDDLNMESPIWDGQGLPPVGCSVEHPDTWSKSVVAYIDANCGEACIQNEEGLYVYSIDALTPFDQDKSDAVNQLNDLLDEINVDVCNNELATALHNAGYRKMEEE